jgi:hypothetical protein
LRDDFWFGRACRIPWSWGEQFALSALPTSVLESRVSLESEEMGVQR